MIFFLLLACIENQYRYLNDDFLPVRDSIQIDSESILDSDTIEGEVDIDTAAPVAPVIKEVLEEGDLIISQVMINAEIEDDKLNRFDEWIELYNTSDYSLVLSGYTLEDKDGDSFEFANDKEIPPNSYIVVCGSQELSTELGINCFDFYERKDFQLGNSNGDEIVFVSPSNQILLDLTYTKAFSNKGKTAFLPTDFYNELYTNMDKSAWCLTTDLIPTKGMSDCST